MLFYLKHLSDDGTAHSSVGELRQGISYLFLCLFCLFSHTIEKSSVNNKLLPCGFPSVYQKILHKRQKNLSDPRLSLPGFFLPKLRRHSYEYVVFFWNLISRNFATMVLHLRVWESCGRKLDIFSEFFCLSFPVYRRKILCQYSSMSEFFYF